MVNFPQKLGNQATGIYTTADGLYTIKEQQRLLSGDDWPPTSSSSGGGANGLGGSWDYVNTTEYTFDGNQTTGTDLSSDVSFGNLSNFDVEFDISSDIDASNNQWFLTNGNYTLNDGVLFGVWSAGGNEGIAIAGGQIGAYGNTPYANIPDQSYITISCEFRLSGSDQASRTIKIYHNGVLQGTQSNVVATSIHFDYLYVGKGSSGGTKGSPSWSTTDGLTGSIKNISIRDNS